MVKLFVIILMMMFAQTASPAGTVTLAWDMPTCCNPDGTNLDVTKVGVVACRASTAGGEVKGTNCMDAGLNKTSLVLQNLPSNSTSFFKAYAYLNTPTGIQSDWSNEVKADISAAIFNAPNLRVSVSLTSVVSGQLLQATRQAPVSGTITLVPKE